MPTKENNKNLSNENFNFEEALKESKDNYLSLIEHANIGITILQEGVRVFNNPFIINFLGYTDKEIDEKEFISVIHPDDRSIILKRIANRINGKDIPVNSLEIRVIAKNGDIKWVQTHSTLIKWNGKPALLAYLIDITYQKEIQANLRKTLDTLEDKVNERTNELKKALTDLKHSESRLAEAQYLSKIGNWEWDMVLHKTYWSKELYQIFGADKNITIPSKESFMEFIHPDDKPLIELHLENLFKTKSPFSVDHRICTPDGKVKFVNSLARVEIRNDKPCRLFGFTQDITGRKNTEAELLVKSSAIASSINGIGMTDPEGRLIYVNRAFIKMWGYYNDTEILGRHIEEFCYGCEFSEILHKKTSGRKSGENSGIRKDGSLFLMQYSATMINDDDGNPFCLFGSFIDISFNKRMEEKLELNAHNLSEVQRIANMGSWEWFIDSGELIWSEEAYNLFGFIPASKPSLETLLGHIHPDDRMKYKKILGKWNSGKIHRFSHNYRIILPNNKIKFIYEEGEILEATISKPKRVIGISQDITHIRRVEEETQTLRTELDKMNRIGTLGAMTTAIAHEVNQPLNAILNNAQAALRFLESSPPDLPEVKEALEDIVSDDKRAGNVIKNIRSLFRGTSELKQFDINDVVKEVMIIMEEDITYSQIEVSFEPDLKLPNVSGNKTQLQQVIQNLITNAIEAMEKIQKNQKQIQIKTQKKDDSEIVVSIFDNGMGFDDKNSKNIFESFFSTKDNGMGIGLALCQSIIEAHGGKIFAENNIDKGAHFWFELPIDNTLK